MMASVLASRVIGLVREMVIAHLGGAAGEVDAYNVAFVIPEILNHVVASGFLSITFIPIFSKYLAAGDERAGWEVFSIIFTVFGTLLALLVAAAWWWAPELVALVAPGLADPGQRAAAIRMTRIITPAQLCFFFGGLLMAVQFAKEQFTLPALAPLLYNLGIILGGVLLYRWLAMAGFAWGVLAGALAGNLLVQYVGARRVGMHLRWRFTLSHPDVKRYVLLSLPLMVGLTMTFSTEFFIRFFGSFLPEGSIASLNYGLRVMLILVGFFGQAAGVASYPYLARLMAEGRLAEMNRLLDDTLRRYIALVIPVATLLMVLSREVIRLLFQRGRFDQQATVLTAEVLVLLLIGAFAFAAQTVVVRGYYAMQNTLFPTLVGTLAVLASLPLYWFGTTQLGIHGLALAVSLSAILQSGLLYMLWNRKSGNRGSRLVYLLFGKLLLLSAAAGMMSAALRKVVLRFLAPDGMRDSLLLCLIIGTVFTALFLAASHALRVEEVMRVAGQIARRLKPGRRRNP